jgi:hypothetical protein
MHPSIMERLRDFSFLLTVLLDVTGGARICLCCPGGEVERSEEVVDIDDVGNHVAFLFRAAELEAAHVHLLDDIVVSVDLVVEVAGDHVILLGFGFDIDDDDETSSFS